jgi:hypothetical protein
VTPAGVTAAVGPGPEPWDRLAAAVDSGDIATVGGAFLGVIGAVVAALIAAGVAVRAYRAQQRAARRQERATFYAEAVRAVEDYMEAPYRILRKDGSHESRRAITQHISDVKSRIAFYTGWMAIHGTDQVRAASSPSSRLGSCHTFSPLGDVHGRAGTAST